MSHRVDPDEAARVLWLDALVANVDRSWRNPNLLVWHGDLWLIDHGATLWFHHGWASGRVDPERFARRPYDASDHVLSRAHRRGPGRGGGAGPQVTPDLLTEVVDLVPDEWLEPRARTARPGRAAAARTSTTCCARLTHSAQWLPTAVAA